MPSQVLELKDAPHFVTSNEVVDGKPVVYVNTGMSAADQLEGGVFENIAKVRPLVDAGYYVIDRAVYVEPVSE